MAFNDNHDWLQRRAFKLVDVAGDFVEICPSSHIEAEHLERALGGCAAGAAKN